MGIVVKTVKEHLIDDATILDVCCGNGISIIEGNFVYKKITGVDVYRPYLDEYLRTIPNSEVIQQDVSKEPLSNFPDNSYDIVMCLDGVEHLERDSAILLMENFERIARKKVIVFTPENIEDPNVPTLNHPKDAWGIKGGDEFQIHRSAFPRTYFKERGWDVHEVWLAKNVYDNTKYYEMLYTKEINK